MLKQIFLFLIVLLILTSCDRGEECRTTLLNKCLRCHAMSTTCAQLGQSKEKWQHTLHAMQKLDRSINDQEVKKLAACLSKPDETIKKLCR